MAKQKVMHTYKCNCGEKQLSDERHKFYARFRKRGIYVQCGTCNVPLREVK